MICKNAEEVVGWLKDQQWLAKYDVKAVISDYDNSRESATTGVQLLRAANEAFPGVLSLLISSDPREHLKDFKKLKKNYPHVEFQLKVSHPEIGKVLDIIEGGTEEEVEKGKIPRNLVPLNRKPRHVLFENDVEIFKSYIADWQSVIFTLFGNEPFQALAKTENLPELLKKAELIDYKHSKPVPMLSETELKDAIKDYHRSVVPSLSKDNLDEYKIPADTSYPDDLKIYQIKLLSFWHDLAKANALLNTISQQVIEYAARPMLYYDKSKNNWAVYDLENNDLKLSEIINGRLGKIALHFSSHGPQSPATDWITNGRAPGVNNFQPPDLTDSEVKNYQYEQTGTLTHAFKGISAAAHVQLVDTIKSIGKIVKEVIKKADKERAEDIKSNGGISIGEGLNNLAKAAINFIKPPLIP